jgi:hypothetical protein
MTRRWFARAAAAAVAVSLAGVAVSATDRVSADNDSKKIRLFNGKNFDGWYAWFPESGKNQDPHNVFKILEDGVIYCSGEKFGFLSTEGEYENYRLWVDFKWGEKKWPPRENAVRDAGVLYHCVGPDKVWNKSLELQIQEGDTGDMWLTPGEGGAPSLTVLGQTYTGGRVIKWQDYEKPNGEWNTTMVEARGDRIVHWVNGKVNLVGTNASLTKGRINLQSEGAELYYRNIILEPLD